MDRLRERRGLLLPAVLAVALTGCSYGEGNSTVPPSPSATASDPSAEGDPTTPPLSEPFEVTWNDSEELLGELSSSRGTYELGPLVSEAGRVVIYIRCYGPGTLTVEVPESATITQPCATDLKDPGTRNQIQVFTPDAFVVKGSADVANLWAIVVTDSMESS